MPRNLADLPTACDWGCKKNSQSNVECWRGYNSASKAKFSKNEVSRRIAELRELKQRGLLLDDFFERKTKECEQ